MTERDLFIAALQLEPADRPSLLDRECAGDSALRQRIEVLLAAHAEAQSAFGSAAGTVDYDAAAGDQATDAASSVIAGRYKLLERIAEGGMGEVWVAEQFQPIKRKVALKLIKPGMDSKSVLARFEAERQALAMMDHPNIAKVLDGGLAENGRPYFVMDYVKGIPITDYCDAARLGIAERLGLFVQVCSAVQHAHQKGIIHRDLKPSNILVAPYDGKPVPKVIDFGLAKALHYSLTERTLHTAHESVLGTPLYMSPEQAQLNNLDVDTRSDIYSLGVLLYELLTGTTPLEKNRFQEAAWDEIRRIIREEEPPRPSTRLSTIDTLPSLAACRQTEPSKLTTQLRGELDWIVMKALEKDRGRRYETANSMARDIQRYLTDEPVEARPPSATYRLQKFVRRNKGRVIAAVVVLIALLMATIVTTKLMFYARYQQNLAQLAADESERARAAAENESDQKERERKRADDERQRADAKAAEALAEKKIAVQQEAAAKAEKQRADAEAKKAVEEGEAAKRSASRVGQLLFSLNLKAAELEAAKTRAENQLLRSEWLLYANQVASAQRAWDTNDLTGAWDHLKACRPGFRGWEFNYLYSRFMQNQATFTAHSAVASVAFSPDGTRVAWVDGDGLQVRSLTENKAVLKTTPKANQGASAPSRLAFSPDGKRIVCGGAYGMLSVRDAATGREILPLKKQDAAITSVAFSPDGKWLLSASSLLFAGTGNTVKLWNAATGDEKLSLPERAKFILTVAAFSPDGKQIATSGIEGTGKGTIQLWNTTTGEKLREISGGDGTNMAYGPDGKRIAAWARSGGGSTIRLWDTATGSEIRAFEEQIGGASMRGLAFEPDGKRIASAWDDGLVRIWDVADGRKTLELKGHVGQVCCLAFSKDGKLLASGGDDETVRIWDPAARHETVAITGFWPATFSPDGKMIVGNVDMVAGKRVVPVWEAATGKQVRVLQLQDVFGSVDNTFGSLTGVVWLPDGKRIVGGLLYGSVRFWDATTGKEETVLKGPPGETMTGICFSPDGTRIATPAYGGTATLWGPAYGKRTIELKANTNLVGTQMSAPMLVTFSPDGKRIAGGACGLGAIKVWDAATGRELLTLGKGQIFDAMSLAFSPDGKRIVIGALGRDSHLPLSVWNADNGEQTLTLDTHSRSERTFPPAVMSVAYSPDGKRIASGDTEGVLKIWEAAEGQETLELKAHSGQIGCLAFSRDGKRLLSCGQDVALKVWDASRGAEAAR